MSSNKKQREKAERRRQQKRRRRNAARQFSAAQEAGTDTRRQLTERLLALRKPEELHQLAPAGIVWQDDDWDELIVERGRVIEPSTITTVAGQAHSCHHNCAVLFWLKYPKYQIATGYVYQKGIWGPHSWLMDGDTIVETTTTRDVYFGVVLNGKDLSEFVVTYLAKILEGFVVSLGRNKAPTNC